MAMFDDVLTEWGPLAPSTTEESPVGPKKHATEAFSTMTTEDLLRAYDTASRGLQRGRGSEHAALEAILRARPDLLAEAERMTAAPRLMAVAGQVAEDSASAADLAEMSLDDLFAELGRREKRMPF